MMSAEAPKARKCECVVTWHGNYTDTIYCELHREDWLMSLWLREFIPTRVDIPIP